MATHTKVTCDVKDCANEGATPRTLDVVFITEQTEGRGIKPRISRKKLDVCDECMEYSTEQREMLTGSGAQGHNTYWFKSKGR